MSKMALAHTAVGKKLWFIADFGQQPQFFTTWASSQILQFLRIRDQGSGSGWLDGLADGPLRGSCQDAGWDCSHLKFGWTRWTPIPSGPDTWLQIRDFLCHTGLSMVSHMTWQLTCPGEGDERERET